MNRAISSLLAVLLCLIANNAISDEPIYLNFSDLPNRTVRVIDTSSTELELNLTGDEELIERNRQKGVTFPFRFTNYKTYKISTKTGMQNQDGSFPFKKILEDVASYSEDKERVRIRVRDSMENMVGMIISGVIHPNGEAEINNLEGGNLDTGAQTLIRSMFSKLSSAETAPKTPLRLGDAFITEMPIEIPIPGQSPIQLRTKSTYVLKKIEAEKAKFDMEMTFEMGNPPENVQITSSGKGSGVMEYNLKTRMRERLDIEMTMDMNIQSGPLNISSKMRSKSSMQQYLVSPGGENPKKSPNPADTPRHPAQPG